jgi:hypothetical protein
MSVHSIESVRSTPEPEPGATAIRPDKGKFEEGEVDFLQKFLDEYLAAESSNKKKGAKKAWVKANIYYKYIAEFEADGPGGPNLSSLLKVWWKLTCFSDFGY